MILTAEDILRLIGARKRFICSTKIVKPNTTSTNYEELLELGLLGWLEGHTREEKSKSLKQRIRHYLHLGCKELIYQLWQGERYDTLEVLLGPLNSDLVRDFNTATSKGKQSN